MESGGSSPRTPELHYCAFSGKKELKNGLTQRGESIEKILANHIFSKEYITNFLNLIINKELRVFF